MSQQNRTTLKSYFEAGDTPTESQFENLIDSGGNKIDDGDFTKRQIGLVMVESDTAIAVIDGKSGIPIPLNLNGFELSDALVTVHDKGITGTTDIQLRRRRAGSDVDMLSTKITIGDEFYARDGVINTSNDDVQTGDVIYVDIDAIHSGTAPNGLSIILTFIKS